jgi:PAB-dependent poly(A)-specific ribonuclease subunit 3
VLAAAPAEPPGDTFSACPYIHDHTRLNQSENAKKRFNVDSPSFTPLSTVPNGSVTPSQRNAAISPKAANAAVFTPKSQRSSESFSCSRYAAFVC